MYYDTNFDSLHFDVMGMGSDLLRDCEESESSGQPQEIPGFGSSPAEKMQESAYQLLQLSRESPSFQSRLQIPALAEPVATADCLSRLNLNHLQLSSEKREEIIDLIAEIRPVHPDGTIINEQSADLSMKTMQANVDLFFRYFNTSYPMIHSATLEINDAEPLFLLSLMILGATYKDRETHQLSVCMYDAIVPHILSGLLSIPVPSLSTLQAFLILECYGMYRAGPYQRENAILIHSLLFNVSIVGGVFSDGY